MSSKSVGFSFLCLVLFFFFSFFLSLFFFWGGGGGGGGDSLRHAANLRSENDLFMPGTISKNVYLLGILRIFRLRSLTVSRYGLALDTQTCMAASNFRDSVLCRIFRLLNK